MKIRDLLEARGDGPVPSNLAQSHSGATRMRDVGGYDRVYHMNRMGMAMAMADGRNKKAVDMDSASFVEKYNVAFPYTDMEHLMMMQAMATIPTDSKELIKRSKSEELPDTGTVSPVSNWNKHTVGKKSK